MLEPCVKAKLNEDMAYGRRQMCWQVFGRGFDSHRLHFYTCKRQILVVFCFFKIYQAMISCERFLNFLLTGGALFRIMDTSLEDYSRGLRGRVGNAVGV